MSLNRFRDRWNTDELVLGAHLSFLCPEVVEVLGLLGFKWLFLDAEHGPLNAQSCSELVRAADVAGLSCLVRVPDIQNSVIESYLDAGVLGIMAPDVWSADRARALVSAVKFSPEGSRGAASKARAANYGLSYPSGSYYSLANRATFTVALIESERGLENLESISAVAGIDYIGIGSNDLALSMGFEQGLLNSKFREVVERAQARIKALGKPQFAMVSDADQAQKARAAGATLIAIQDTVLLAASAADFLKRAKQ